MLFLPVSLFPLNQGKHLLMKPLNPIAQLFDCVVIVVVVKRKGAIFFEGTIENKI